MTRLRNRTKINPFTFGGDNSCSKERTDDANDLVAGEDLTHDDVSNQSRQLLTHFVHDKMKANGIECPVSATMLIEPGTPAGPRIVNAESVADTLRLIGDQLDSDVGLQLLIDKISCDAPADTLFDVSVQIFKDGKYTWGRIVALFYFAFKLIVKVLKEEGSRQLILMRGIIEWTVSFILKYVAKWILERGGWCYIIEYVSSTLKQTLFVIAAGVIMALVIVAKESLKS